MIRQSKRGFTVVCDQCGAQGSTQPNSKRLRKDMATHEWKDLAGGQHQCHQCAAARKPKPPEPKVRKPDTRTPEQRKRHAQYMLAVCSVLAMPPAQRRW